MFAWSNNRNSSSGHSRPEHISSYLNDPTLKPSTRKTSRDDSTYDTIFQTKDSKTLLMRVHMPPYNSSKQCPAPIMTLVGIQGNHPWLDDRMTVVGYGPISTDAEFQKSRLLLSQIVNSVVTHFQLNPPTNLRIMDSSLQKMQPANRASTSEGRRQQNNGSGRYSESWNGDGNGSSQGPTPRKKDPSEMHFAEVVVMAPNDEQQVLAMMDAFSIPVPPPTIVELNSISKNDVMDVLTETNKLLPILEQNMMVTRTEEIKNSILSANHVNATTTLSKRENLHNLHDEVKNLQSELRAKVDKFNELKARQLELCKPISKDLVLKKMKKATKTSMNESDDLAYEWLEKSDADCDVSHVNSFIDEFLEKRIVHHVRAAKVERIQNS